MRTRTHSILLVGSGVACLIVAAVGSILTGGGS